MQQESVFALPVIDDQKRFIGMIDRDKLTSSIVLDLVDEKK
ncbi:MAG: hypothetical protein ACU83V_05170 [Gammaproteobacteria bacterium]